MSDSSMQQRILTGIGVGIIAGVVIGFIGAYLNLPMGVRGGLIGAAVVVAQQYMRRTRRDSEARGQS